MSWIHGFLVCYMPLARNQRGSQKRCGTGARIRNGGKAGPPQSKRLTAMLRREPTRIEMKSEDLEEFDRFQAQQKKAAKEDAGAPESKQDDRKAAREGRIGLRSDSPNY